MVGQLGLFRRGSGKCRKGACRGFQSAGPATSLAPAALDYWLALAAPDLMAAPGHPLVVSSLQVVVSGPQKGFSRSLAGFAGAHAAAARAAARPDAVTRRGEDDHLARAGAGVARALLAFDAGAAVIRRGSTGPVVAAIAIAVVVARNVFRPRHRDVERKRKGKDRKHCRRGGARLSEQTSISSSCPPIACGFPGSETGIREEGVGRLDQPFRFSINSTKRVKR